MKDSPLKRGLRGVLRRFGYSVVPLNHMHDPDLRRAALMERIDVNVVLDIGANRGQYAQLIRKHGYRGTIHSFEPVPTVAEQLRRQATGDNGWHCHSLALGDQAGTRVLRIGPHTELSSLLNAVKPEWAAVEEVEVGVETLNRFIPPFIGDDDILYLKMDVQGGESLVLDGAGALLPRIVAIELEMSSRPFYDRECLLGEMAHRLEDAGFWMVGIDPFLKNAKTGYVQQVNAIFLRQEWVVQ